MLNRFKHIVEEMRGLIDDSRSASFLLAVSGGIDSMCLADLWVRSFGADTCAIAHCNFNLRGEDSDGDEALVSDWAEVHGVRIHKVSFDTVQYASENGISIEMAARELRYRWFGELCQEHEYKAVVVAHHADDNAETMVLNMVRGAGLKGLSGMKPVSPLPLSRHCEERSDVAILRPLLTFTRKQIEGHAFAWKVPYREDKTNASTIYRRNSIRHEVFPLFERMNPSYVRTLNREMTYFKDAFDIVDDWCRAQLPHVIARSEATWQSVPLAISIPALLAIPQWRYLLYYILEPYGFNSAVLESLEALLLSDRTVSGKRFESEEYILRMERGHMLVSRKIAGQAGNDATPVIPGLTSVIPGSTGDPFTVVRIPGAYHINGVRVVVETLPWTPDMPLKQPEDTLILDADKLKFPIVCRKWRLGDWMIPLGMKGKKKLSDLFNDLKYSHSAKADAIVIVDCRGDCAQLQHVAAVLPVRIDDHYKVTEDTRNIIRIRIAEN